MTRQAKVDVSYTPKAKNPSEQCQWCVHFFSLPSASTGTGHRCTKVEGSIEPQGWCKLFKANSQ